MVDIKELLQQADEYLKKVGYDNPDHVPFTESMGLIKALADEVRGKEWQDISTAPKDDEDLEINTYNGITVQSATFWEGYYVDRFSDYIEPQPTLFKPLPQPPKEVKYHGK